MYNNKWLRKKSTHTHQVDAQIVKSHLNYLDSQRYILFIHLIVSATFSGVDTLKYPPFHGICFFVEIFSFF